MFWAPVGLAAIRQRAYDRGIERPSMTRRRKTLLVVPGVVVLAAGAFAWYRQATRTDRQVRAQGKPRQAPPVEPPITAGSPLLSTGGDPIGAGEGEEYPIRPVSFTQVRLADGFWLPRRETNRRVTIPHNLKQLTKAHSFDGQLKTH